MFDFGQTQEEQLKNKIFVGIVEENIDPLRIGRIKIRVQGVFDDADRIPTMNLPWAHPWKNTDGKDFRKPDVGKIVNIIFPTGDIYYLEYIFSEHYNINLENKLKGLKDDEYKDFIALLFDHRTQIYSDNENLMLDYFNNQISIDKGGINLHLKDNDQTVHIGHNKASQSAILGDHWLEWFDELMNTLAVPNNLTGNLGAPVLRPALDLVIQKYFSIRKTFASQHVKLVDNAKCLDQGLSRESSPTLDDNLTKINADPILSSEVVPTNVKDNITTTREKNAEETLLNEPNKQDKELKGSHDGGVGEDGLIYGDLSIDIIITDDEAIAPDQSAGVDLASKVVQYTYEITEGYGWDCVINNNLGLPPIKVTFDNTQLYEDQILTILKKQMFMYGGDFKTTEWTKMEENSYKFGGTVLPTTNGETTGETTASADPQDGVKRGVIIYGGADYATPAWMKEQWIAAGLSLTNRTVIFESQLGRSADVIMAANPDITFVAVAGFSGGGPKVWQTIDKNIFDFIGLMDPATEDRHMKYVSEDWKGRVRIMFRPENWGTSGYVGICRKNLKKILDGKNTTYSTNSSSIEYVQLNHELIPLEFFKKYKTQLQG
jgi:hypothetical protein